MRTLISSTLLILAFSACSSTKPLQTTDRVSTSVGHSRTKEIALIDANTYQLTDITTDVTYGYKQSNPIKVGGASESIRPINERRFLNGLTGPNGETIQYHRTGSCCGKLVLTPSLPKVIKDTNLRYLEGCCS